MSRHHVDLSQCRWIKRVTLLGIVSCLVHSMCMIHAKRPQDRMDCSNIPFQVSSAYRYPNLFQREGYIASIAQTREIDEYFKMDKIKARYPFSGVCNNWFRRPRMNHGSDTRDHNVRLPNCIENPFGRQNGLKHINRQCCETKMSMTIPSTVVSVYTGEILQVKHMPNSYQFLHEGECAPGSSCTGGNCRVNQRLQWILVEKDGTDAFVPVSVGNNCYCGWT